MKRVQLLFLLLTSLVWTAEASAIFYSHPLLRMYRTVNITLNDNFYTTSLSQRDYSISCCGYTLPPNGASFIGFVDQMTPPNVAQTLPFHRFYMGAPETEHFYTSSASETAYVESIGYQYESDEGRVFTSPLNGTTKLYRIYFGYPNGDFKHFYSTDLSEINSRLLSGGWGQDSTNEFIWGIPQQLPPASARVSVVKYCNFGLCSTPVIVGPAVVEYSPFANTYYCGGIVDLYIDGVFRSSLQNWNYGITPGSINVYSCYISLSGISGIPHGSTHQVRLEYSGFSGYHSVGGAFEYVTPSFTTPFNFPF